MVHIADIPNSSEKPEFEFVSGSTIDPANTPKVGDPSRQSFEFPSVSPPRSETPKLEDAPKGKLDATEGKNDELPIEKQDSESDSIISLNADDDQNGKLPDVSKSLMEQFRESKIATKPEPSEVDLENLRAIRKMKARLYSFALEHSVDIDAHTADLFILNLVNELAPGSGTEVRNFNEFMFAFRVFEVVLRDIEKKLGAVEAKISEIQERKGRFVEKHEEILKMGGTDKERRKKTIINNERQLKDIRPLISSSVRDAQKISRWVITAPFIFKAEYDKLKAIFTEYLMPANFEFVMDDAKMAAMRLEEVCKFLVHHRGL